MRNVVTFDGNESENKSILFVIVVIVAAAVPTNLRK
jgi:hypothetical protein